ncbi:hypothetical protein [Flavivirga algicola]|uniref:Uncharacterized protein n=1 Tax=Flavivirga algicola TaxID=2729136 RepID=A0ABX1RVF7_9FLAO|nr:hypothetical protein [Flavivirga algicola]NMH87537.1 hypothetical protein [Flavivirga algicola]
MKKKHLYLSIIILVFICFYLGYGQVYLNQELKEVKILNHESLENKKHYINSLEKLITYGYKNTKLSEEGSKKLSSINEDKIVLYVTDGNCNSCILEALNYFDILSSNINKDKFLFIGNFKTESDFKKYVDENISKLITNTVYCNDNEFGFSKGINHQPLIFILKKDLSINSLFIPDFYPYFTEKYYTEILPSYFKKKQVLH